MVGTIVFGRSDSPCGDGGRRSRRPGSQPGRGRRRKNRKTDVQSSSDDGAPNEIQVTEDSGRSGSDASRFDANSRFNASDRSGAGGLIGSIKLSDGFDSRERKFSARFGS